MTDFLRCSGEEGSARSSNERSPNDVARGVGSGALGKSNGGDDCANNPRANFDVVIRCGNCRRRVDDPRVGAIWANKRGQMWCDTCHDREPERRI
jgi:hypothetical protein